MLVTEFSPAILVSGQTLVITLGLSRLPHVPPLTGTYSIILTDTVHVDSHPKLIQLSMLPDCYRIFRNSVQKPCPASRIPPEVLALIFSYCDVITLGRLSQVCKAWAEVPWQIVNLNAVRHRIRWEVSAFDKAPPVLVSRGNGTGHSRFMDQLSFIPSHVQDIRLSQLSPLRSLRSLHLLGIRELDISGCSRIDAADLIILRSCPDLHTFRFSLITLSLVTLSFQVLQHSPFPW